MADESSNKSTNRNKRRRFEKAIKRYQKFGDRANKGKINTLEIIVCKKEIVTSIYGPKKGLTLMAWLTI